MIVDPFRSPIRTRADLLREFYEAPEDALFDQKTVAAVKKCSTAKLERDRWAGTGIPFLKDGRLVRYVKRDVLADLAQLLRCRSTSDDPQTARRAVLMSQRKARAEPNRSGQRDPIPEDPRSGRTR